MCYLIGTRSSSIDMGPSEARRALGVPGSARHFPSARSLSQGSLPRLADAPHLRHLTKFFNGSRACFEHIRPIDRKTSVRRPAKAEPVLNPIDFHLHSTRKIVPGELHPSFG